MDDFFQHLESYHLPISHWLIIAFCGFLYGLLKGGIKGIGSLAIPLMAFVFGGKASTGLVVPMLLMADVFAVPYFIK